jgi:dTDP-glucose 4,6-dehydratase
MKILVTGGAGFIGSNFIQFILALRQDYHVVNYDKLTYAGNLTNLGSVANDPRYKFVMGDVSDPSGVAEAMQGCEIVVHFAAETHVDRSIYEPSSAIETNIIGTFALLQAARKLKIQRFVHISTDEVYGDLLSEARAEESFLLNPSSPYSASKASADLLVRSHVRTYGLPAMIIRASNNYGPYQFPEKLLPLVITNALENKPLPIYGDGRQERNWLHVEDCCRGILAVLECGRTGEVYNVGGRDVLKNIDLVQQILHVMDKPESLIQYVSDRPGHDRRYALNSRKITAELGWRPLISLDEGLARTIAWYRSNADWIARVRDRAYRAYYEKYYQNRDSTLQGITSLPDPRST